MYALPYKTKQIFFVLIKLSLVIAAFCFICFKLSGNEALLFSDFLKLTAKHGLFSLKHFSFLILLSALNWFLEILKWQTLVKPLKKLTFFEATAQSLGSLTVSIFTPNRIGEYGAKSLFYNKTQIAKIVSINGLHNLLQLFITIAFGSIGLTWFTSIYQIKFNETNIVLVVLILIGVAILSLVILNKFRQNNLEQSGLFNFVKSYPKSLVFIGFWLSGLRYAVFSFQFYYLLHIFGVNLNYRNAMMVISTMYFLASVVPSIAIFDFAIKGSIAIFLFSFLQIQALTMVYVTTLMWLFNFAFPSLIGSYFVLIFKWPKPTVSL